MKKTISITIGGVLFHIEEDGYHQLREYLDQVHGYFSQLADSREILNDIESRIAELFIARHQDRQEAITAEDVASMMRTMGTVADFAAEGEAEETYTSSNAGTHTNTSGPKSRATGSEHAGTTSRPTVLRRNLKDKLLAGVCSGIGQYLGVNSVWIRFAFLAFFFGMVWLPAIPGFLFLAYVALWIAVPGVYMDELPTVRKLFRSRKAKVLGGVCEGLANYLNIDVAVVRLLFIIGLLAFGTGILLYIVFWIIIPKANSLTDEMQASGTPINLASIEETVKRNLEPENKQEGESTITRIVLFPFRVLGQILTALGPIAKALLTGFRIVFGFLFLVLALLSLLSVTALFMAQQGIIDWNTIVYTGTFPFQQLLIDIPLLTIYGFLFATVAPLLLLLLLAIKLLFINLRIPSYVVVTFVVLWVVSLFVAGMGGISLASVIKSDASVTQTTALPLNTQTLNLEMGLSDHDYNWCEINLDVDTWKGDSIRIERTYSASGRNEADAARYATAVTHGIKLTDSTLYIDGRYELPAGVAFRDQMLTVRVLIPEGVPFSISPKFATNLNNLSLDWWDRGRILKGTRYRFSGDTLRISALGGEIQGEALVKPGTDEVYRVRIKVGDDEKTLNISTDEDEEVTIDVQETTEN